MPPGTPYRPRARRHLGGLVDHIRDPADVAALAASASDRLPYRYAIRLYQNADPGDWSAPAQLAELLADRGDLDEPSRSWLRADTGEEDAARRLAELPAGRLDLNGLGNKLDGSLAEREDMDRLRARADAGDDYAAAVVNELVAERGHLDGLRARADDGDRKAAVQMAELLAGRGDRTEPSRSCAPWLTLTMTITRVLASGWPTCWPSAATWTRPNRSCVPWPTPTGVPGNQASSWPSCWPSTGT